MYVYMCLMLASLISLLLLVALIAWVVKKVWRK